MLHTNTQVMGGFSGFLAWWSRELREIFRSKPPRGPQWARRRFVVAPSADGVRWMRESDQGRKAIGLETPTIDPTVATLSFLRRKARKRRAVPLGLRLPKTTCLERRVSLPAAARADFASILDLDIERVTPFKRSDVYAAFVEDTQAPRVAGKTALRHLIVKRALVDDAADALRAHGLELSFADCWDEDGVKALRVNFLAPPPLPPPPPSRAVRVLGFASAALAACAVVFAMQRYDAAIATLDARIAQATKNAGAVRDRIDESESRLAALANLQALKFARPSPAKLLAELTRIIPDDTHLTELRLSPERIAIAGLSDKAVGLVGLLDQSPLLQRVEITAPVLLDQSSGKETFRIEARLQIEEQPARAQLRQAKAARAETGLAEPVP